MSETVEVKTGDVVRLKSGGPNMVIGNDTNEKGEMIADCYWFDKEDKYQRMWIPIMALKLAPGVPLPRR